MLPIEQQRSNDYVASGSGSGSIGRTTETRYKKTGEPMHHQGVLLSQGNAAKSAVIQTKGREIKRIPSKTKMSEKVSSPLFVR